MRKLKILQPLFGAKEASMIVKWVKEGFFPARHSKKRLRS